MKKEILFIPLNSGKDFTNRIIHDFLKIATEGLEGRLCKGKEVRFPNGEYKYILEESVRAKEVYIVQLCDDPYSQSNINDNIMVLMGAINAAKFGDAKNIRVILPHFPYSRQDKLLSREPLMAQVVSRMLELAGADQVITLDIHSDAIKGYFYDIDMIGLHGIDIISKYITENMDVSNIMVVAPDVGSSKRSNFYAKKLGCGLAIIDKMRDYSRNVEESIVSVKLVGEVKGKDVLITDDMVATGGTLISACKLLKEKGARSIYIAVSIPFFTNEGYLRFEEAYKEGLFCQFISTDAVFWGEDFLKKYHWYREQSVSSLFAEVIFSLSTNNSVGYLMN